MKHLKLFPSSLSCPFDKGGFLAKHLLLARLIITSADNFHQLHFEHTSSYLVINVIYKVHEYSLRLGKEYCLFVYSIIITSMNSFSSYQLSPISGKNNQKNYFIEQFPDRFAAKEVLNKSDFFDRKNQRCLPQNAQALIIATTKTILYILSPQIDLIANIENDIYFSDKFQKTKTLLYQLMNQCLNDDSFLRKQMMETSEQIDKLQAEIQEISEKFSSIEQQNREKDKQIEKYKKIIIQLTKAYQEAKTYFTDEILEQKYQIQELKMQLSAGERIKKKSKSKSKPKVTLDIPTNSQTSSGNPFTDRSIYKRFTASEMKQNETITESNINGQTSQVYIQNYTSNRYLQEKHDYQIQKLQRRIVEMNQEVIKLKEKMQGSKKDYQDQAKQLRQKVKLMQAQILQKSRLVKEKNKIITELLDSLEKKR